jgi:hypothetical protein
MLFVADALPLELVRIIEFLNEQMSPAEILGVELRQYVNGQHVVYVPRVVGATATAMTVKGVTQTTVWDRDSFLAAAAGRCAEQQMALIRRLFDDAESRGGALKWGRGATPGVNAYFDCAGQPTPVWYLNANDERSHTRAYLQLALADLVGRLGPVRVDEAAGLLETIPALKTKIADARANDWRKYPSVYLDQVATDQAAITTLFEAIGRLTGTEPPAAG